MAKKKPSPPPTAPAAIRNRNKAHVRVPASSLVPSPDNWRTHPPSQRAALRDLLGEVGFVGNLIALETEGGKLQILDGHLRQEELGETLVDVCVVDLTPAERAKVLATHDPLTALAQADGVKLDALLAQVHSDSAAVQDLLAGIAQEVSAGPATPTVLQPVDTKPPPRMSWVLVGIPTVRFGDIAALVEQLALVPGIVLETTSNDGPTESGA